MKQVKISSMLILNLVIIVFIFVPMASAQSVYKVGAIMAKTGYGAYLGRSAINGINLAMKEIGTTAGNKIEVIIYDSEGKEDMAVLAGKRLIEKDKVVAILGPLMTGEGEAMVPVIEKAKVPMFFLGGGTKVTDPPEQRRFCFRLSFSHSQAPQKALEHFKRINIKKFGILYVNNAFGRDGMEELSKGAPKYGMEVAGKESVEQGDVDVTPQLTKLRDSGAEVIVLWIVGTPAVITYKNYRQMGLKIPLLGNHGLADSSFRQRVENEIIGTDIIAIRPFDPEGLPDTDPAKKFLINFVKNYANAYGQGYVPGTFDCDGYDGVRLVAEAVRNEAKTPLAIRDYMETKIKNWEGTTGTYNFSPNDHGGLDYRQMIIVTATKGGGWKLYNYSK